MSRLIIWSSFQFASKQKYAVCTYKNHLIEAILMSPHNIHFQNKTCHRDRIARLLAPCQPHKKI